MKKRKTQDGSVKAKRGGDPLANWIVPGARARWIGAGVAYYTPQVVESIFRQAMAGDLVSQWELFDLMEATWPRLTKNLGQLKDDVCANDFRLSAWAPKGKDPSPEAEKRAALVEELIWSMAPRADHDENDWEDTIRDLLDARGKGLSVLEVEWETRATSAGAAIAPRATRWVHPSWYGYPNGASDGRLMLRHAPANGVEGGQVEGGWAEFPPHKFIIGVCKARTGHPLGNALLHTLGFWWAAANFTADWFLNLAQVFGQPIRWATYSSNMGAADQAKLKLMLENMGSAAWGMFPEGTVMELKEAMKSASDNPQKILLDTADKVCDLVILRQTLTSDVSETGGNRALGEVHERVLGGVQLACAKWACKVLNQLVRSICELNFGDTRECPYLMPPGDGDETPAELAGVLVQIGQAGLEPTDAAIPELSERLGVELQRKAVPEPLAGFGAFGADKQDPEKPDPEKPDQPDKPEEPEQPEKPVQAKSAKQPDEVDEIAARRAKALGEAYRGAMAPFRQIILASNSREECLMQLARAYADWKPERLVAEMEDALQICAAAGATKV